MIGQEIPATTGEDVVRFVRTLGQHRYVAGRLHLAHAFAVEAAWAAGETPALAEAAAWARGVLADPEVDAGSRDERLHRRATDAEIVAILTAFYRPADAARERARATLERRLAAIGASAFERAPFDESAEEDVFPVLLDAGWELLPLTALDAERHRGAMDAFDDFEVARFEEENAVPAIVTLHELPVFGGVELLRAVDDAGALVAPFVLWTAGSETYLDYVLRGILRASRLN